MGGHFPYSRRSVDHVFRDRKQGPRIGTGRIMGGTVQMKISAPKQITVIIAVILAVLGILPMFGLTFGSGAILSWGVLAGFIVLLAGVLYDGLSASFRSGKSRRTAQLLPADML